MSVLQLTLPLNTYARSDALVEDMPVPLDLDRHGFAVDVVYGRELFALLSGLGTALGTRDSDAPSGLRNSRCTLLGQNVVKRTAVANWASIKLKPHCLKETQELGRSEFGKPSGLKTANPRASYPAQLRNLLLGLVCSDPGVTKRFSKLKEVHAPPAIR
ncbi:hypothetical protein OKW31_005061 [Paraburkholderia atlantica]